MKKKGRKPDAKAGVFGICFGVAALAMVIFYPHNSGESAGTRYSLAGFSILLLAWGSGQIAAARKMEGQESEDAKVQDEHDVTSGYPPQSEGVEKLEKSGSMTNVLVLLTWILLAVAVLFLLGFGCLMLFRHER